jgi:hypothetical protein
MDKPETQAALKQEREWTNLDIGSIGIGHSINTPEPQALLEQDSEWSN